MFLLARELIRRQSSARKMLNDGADSRMARSLPTASLPPAQQPCCLCMGYIVEPAVLLPTNGLFSGPVVNFSVMVEVACLGLVRLPFLRAKSFICE